MSLLQASRIGFRYNLLEPLFRQVSLDIDAGDRIALVGPNGAGKSTLLGILAGELEPDDGTIARRRGLRIATLSQRRQAKPGESLGCWLQDPALGSLEKMLRGLGFETPQLALPITELSSGQRTTAELARALALGSDLLLLDEPTNHLDIRARGWLAGHLEAQPAACVIVSHDRRFLEDFATRVFELNRGEFHEYGGGYALFERERAVRENARRCAYEQQQRRFAALERAAERRLRLSREAGTAPRGQRDSNNVKVHYRQKAGTVARTARLLAERRTTEVEIAKPWEETPIADLTFRPVARSGDPPLECLSVSKGYDGRAVLRDVSFQCRRGERWALCGPNGCGKTTLLRLLLGEETPDAGTIRVAPNVRFGYYAQEAGNLAPRRSALDLCADVCSDRQWIRTLLACLKLPRVLADQPVGRLSPGERAKVGLARVLLEGANVLLLDEPTNHLEVEAQEALAASLRGYPGAVLLVSHDRRFTERCADHILDLGAGRAADARARPAPG